jgi:hypothetical protein
LYTTIHHPLEQVLWWAVSWLNADVEEREEKQGERGEAGCKITASLDTETKKLCERDKLTMY